MRTENVLSNFELMVMLALIRLGDNAYGVPISQEIEERSGRRAPKPARALKSPTIQERKQNACYATLNWNPTQLFHLWGSL